MAGGLNDIIARLEEQKSAIERALSALREIEGSGVQSREEKPPAPRKVRAKHTGANSGQKASATKVYECWATIHLGFYCRMRGLHGKSVPVCRVSGNCKLAPDSSA